MMSFPVDSSQTISTIASDGLTILCGPAPKAFGDLPYGLDIVRFRFKSLFCLGKTLRSGKQSSTGTSTLLENQRPPKVERQYHPRVLLKRQNIHLAKWVRQRRSLDASTYGPGAYSERRCRSSCPNLL